MAKKITGKKRKPKPKPDRFGSTRTIIVPLPGGGEAPVSFDSKMKVSDVLRKLDTPYTI